MYNLKYKLSMKNISTASSSFYYINEFDGEEMSMMEVTGTGNIQIRNTGGSSASEGGMGTGGGTEKGAGITAPEDDKKHKSNSESGKDEDKWDPLKPKEEKGKEKS
jgi:hypothetical protein